jgi:hypothetical protein
MTDAHDGQFIEPEEDRSRGPEEDDFWKGFKPLPRRPGEPPITLEHIQAIQEQLDHEDMMRALYPDRDDLSEFVPD